MNSIALRKPPLVSSLSIIVAVLSSSCSGTSQEFVNIEGETTQSVFLRDTDTSLTVRNSSFENMRIYPAPSDGSNVTMNNFILQVEDCTFTNRLEIFRDGSIAINNGAITIARVTARFVNFHYSFDLAQTDIVSYTNTTFKFQEVVVEKRFEFGYSQAETATLSRRTDLTLVDSTMSWTGCTFKNLRFAIGFVEVSPAQSLMNATLIRTSLEVSNCFLTDSVYWGFARDGEVHLTLHQSKIKMFNNFGAGVTDVILGYGVRFGDSRATMYTTLVDSLFSLVDSPGKGIGFNYAFNTATCISNYTNSSVIVSNATLGLGYRLGYASADDSISHIESTNSRILFTNSTAEQELSAAYLAEYNGKSTLTVTGGSVEFSNNKVNILFVVCSISGSGGSSSAGSSKCTFQQSTSFLISNNGLGGAESFLNISGSTDGSEVTLSENSFGNTASFSLFTASASQQQHLNSTMTFILGCNKYNNDNYFIPENLNSNNEDPTTVFNVQCPAISSSSSASSGSSDSLGRNEGTNLESPAASDDATPLAWWIILLICLAVLIVIVVIVVVVVKVLGSLSDDKRKSPPEGSAAGMDSWHPLGPPSDPNNNNNMSSIKSQSARSTTGGGSIVNITTTMKCSDYRKGKILGAGGFGKVFKGMDMRSGGFVAAKEIPKNAQLEQVGKGGAMKTINQTLQSTKVGGGGGPMLFDFVSMSNNTETTRMSDEEKRYHEELQAEINLLSRLEHKHVVKYLGSDSDDANVYIFMEYLPGGSVRAVIDEYGKLTPTIAATYMQQLLLGLEYLHGNGIVHRDIKAGNLILDSEGVLKLADFGCSDAADAINSMKGTPFWMAPEAIRGEAENLGSPSDIWSVGCTLIEMLSGKAPFTWLKDENGNPFSGPTRAVNTMRVISDGGEPFDQGMRGLPLQVAAVEEAKQFVLDCLNREPNSRPTAVELLQHPFIEKYSKVVAARDGPFDEDDKRRDSTGSAVYHSQGGNSQPPVSISSDGFKTGGTLQVDAAGKSSKEGDVEQQS